MYTNLLDSSIKKILQFETKLYSPESLIMYCNMSRLNIYLFTSKDHVYLYLKVETSCIRQSQREMLHRWHKSKICVIKNAYLYISNIISQIFQTIDKISSIENRLSYPMINSMCFIRPIYDILNIGTIYCIKYILWAFKFVL